LDVLQRVLQLHECLQGKALKVVDNLGHSAAAYEAANVRLGRKYGGKRRALTLRMEELHSFKVGTHEGISPCDWSPVVCTRRK